MVRRIWILGALFGLLALPRQDAATAETVATSPEVAQTIRIDDLIVKDDSVSGTVVNKSSATLREVELRLRQVWHWQDERHPGDDDPGRALPFALAADVAPNGSVPFTFEIPRLPQRSDGHFVTTIDVVGFSEVRP